jgi:hypothetical protein
MTRERITYHLQMLMHFTWHSRDYVKKILVDQGVTDFAGCGKLLNGYIEKSRDLQVCSYLANEYKHAGVDDTQKWATDLAPRYGDIYVCGIMESFPGRMKPTVAFTSKSEPQLELAPGSSMISNFRSPILCGPCRAWLKIRTRTFSATPSASASEASKRGYAYSASTALTLPTTLVVGSMRTDV